MYCLILYFLMVVPLYAEMTPNDINWYTEEYPPFNYVENGKKTGFAIDILIKMFEKLNLNKTVKDIAIVPWARGYNDVQKKTNVCLFTMTKTEERVKNHGFKWVGPVSSTNQVLLALKKMNLKINDVTDLNKYRACTIREDVAEQTLVGLGYSFNSVDRTSNVLSIIKKLVSDRCHIWAYGKIASQWLIKQHNYNPDDFETVYSMTEKKYMYYAFNKNTPDSVILPLQKAFDELKKEGIVDQITARYLK